VLELSKLTATRENYTFVPLQDPKALLNCHRAESGNASFRMTR